MIFRCCCSTCRAATMEPLNPHIKCDTHGYVWVDPIFKDWMVEIVVHHTVSDITHSISKGFRPIALRSTWHVAWSSALLLLTSSVPILEVGKKRHNKLVTSLAPTRRLQCARDIHSHREPFSTKETMRCWNTTTRPRRKWETHNWL